MLVHLWGSVDDGAALACCVLVVAIVRKRDSVVCELVEDTEVLFS